MWQEPHYGVFMVTGHDEALASTTTRRDFSSCNAVSGPFVQFSEPFEGDDVSDIIERHRDELPFSDQLPSFDPPRHTAHRALMMRLLTPGRLRANEEFMGRLADRQLDELVDAGPVRVHQRLRRAVHAAGDRRPGGRPRVRPRAVPRAPDQRCPRSSSTSRSSSSTSSSRPTSRTAAATPRDDIMTAMATATFPDGSTPEVNDVALLAANLFAGGQETTVRLLSFALRIIAERPDIQEPLRTTGTASPTSSRRRCGYESPLRAQFRMAKVRTTVAGVDIPAGSTMMLLPGAANRDPRLFENPAEFDLDRRQRPATTWPSVTASTTAPAPTWPGPRVGSRSTGSSTARRTSRSRRTAHGPADARRYEYLPTYFLRGLVQPRLELTPGLDLVVGSGPRSRRRAAPMHQLELGGRRTGGGPAVDRAARCR